MYAAKQDTHDEALKDGLTKRHQPESEVQLSNVTQDTSQILLVNATNAPVKSPLRSGHIR